MTRLSQVKCVAVGTKCLVVMLPKVMQQFSEIPVGSRAALVRSMELYSNGKVLPPTRFTVEKRENVGHGASYMVWAFKDAHFRVYGAVEKLEGRDCFVCTEIDNNKKRRKADPEKLKAAAMKLKQLMDTNDDA